MHSLWVLSFALADPGDLVRQAHDVGSLVMLPPGCAKVSTNPRHQLPAVYCLPYFARSGGLIAYGPDTVSPYRRAAQYVDRILKGEKPADLPVQAPTQYELVINLKTAKTSGITLPDTVLARANEVIE